VRIAYYTNCYKPRVNGVVRSISILKRALEELGHEVHLFAPRSPGYIDDEPTVYRYPALPVEGIVLYRFAIPFSPRLRRIPQDIHPDIVHAHHPILMGREGVRTARRCGVPLVSTLHSQYWRYYAQMPLVKGVVRTVCARVILSFMRQCQRTVVATEDLRQHVADDAPDLASRLVKLPNPLQVERFTNVNPEPVREAYGLDKAFTFAVAARLSPEKGLSDLLEAFAILAKRRQGVRLLVLGDGPMREDLQTRTAELQVSNRVIFAGMIPFEHIPAHLVAADAFAYSSQVDAQPLVLGEAMAAGLPIVAYDVPFIRESVIDGQNGLLSAPNARALAERMQELVDHPDLRETLAYNGRQMVRRYDARHVAEQLVKVYENAIARHGTPD